MKIFLGLSGVTLVLLSVFASGGVFTYLGVPATLISLEVIPFLLLAVGVDNIYVMVQTYQNTERDPFDPIEEHIAKIVGKVGPSMLLTGTTQSAAFLISALTPMPGVRAFSLYASLAIILNFILQVTCFVVLMTIDAKREAARRMDLFCCIRLNINNKDYAQNAKSFLHKFFNKYYTKLLMHNYVRAGVIVVFVGFFFTALALCDQLKVGLNQKLAMPYDSYQIQYFEALQKHLAVGPPVFFVLKDGYNYSDVESMRRLCGGSTCHSNSLQSLISSASFFSKQTYIAQSSVNWVDDYFEWLSADPLSTSCCYEFVNTSAVAGGKHMFCDHKRLKEEESTRLDSCVPCKVERGKYNIPTEKTLMRYVDSFLHQNPSESCIKAGHAMYGDAVQLIRDKFGHVVRVGRMLKI
jgi:Niemann-Pick C1 protein